VLVIEFRVTLLPPHPWLTTKHSKKEVLSLPRGENRREIHPILLKALDANLVYYHVIPKGTCM